jgi:multiple sugar transport system substrate-binding protein
VDLRHTMAVMVSYAQMGLRKGMDRVKGKIVALALVMALASLVAIPALAAAPENREPVTLSLVNIWTAARIPLMEAQLKEFQKLYPWITVENNLSQTGFEKEIVAIAAGTPPDVLMVDRVRLAEFVEAGLLQPLDDFMKRDNVNPNIFYRSEFVSCQYKGQTWSLPLPTASLSLLYYNRMLFGNAGYDPDGAPKTWDQMLQMGLKLQKITADGRVEVGGGSISYFPRHRLAQMAYLNGATIFGPGSLDVNYLTDRTRETASFIADYGVRVKLGGNFTQNTLAMTTGGEWSYFEYQQANPEINQGITLVPASPNGKYQNIVAAAWSYGIPVGVKHPYESWLLVNFLATSEEGAFRFVFEQGRPSPVIKFTQDRRYWQKNPFWSAIGDSLNNSVNIPGSPVANKIISADIKWYNALYGGAESPGNALEKLQDEVKSIIAAYKAGAK